MRKLLLGFLLLHFAVIAGAQGTETFSNLPAASSAYTTVSWIGDNGLSWSATDSRTDQNMNGRAVTVRNGAVKCNGIPNGAGSVSFKHQQMFTGSGGVLELWINNILIGAANVTTTLQTATFNNINVSGPFNLEIRQTTASLRIGVDDISWTSYSGSPCVAPSAQPTSFNVSGTTNTSSSITFTQASGAEKYLAIRSTASSLTSQPVNGVTYSEGDLIGNGIVAYSGPNASFLASDLQPGTTYYFFLYSYNDVNCSGGPAYNITAPLTGNLTTTTPPACVAPGGTVSNLQLNASSSSINGIFDIAAGADGYLVIRSTNATLSFTPANGISYNPGDVAGNGIVVKSGTGTSFVTSGLTSSTNYYLFVYAMSAFSCTGGPLYNTTAVSSNISTTTSSSGDWPTGYYTYADGKNCATLKTALRQIIDNTSSSFSGDTYLHQPQTYDDLWNQYKISDIKPREVGSGSAYVIWDMYSDNPAGLDPYNYTPGTNQCGNYSGEDDCYNREHSFPKSWFNDAAPMHNDYHHVFPTDGYVNGKRSNYKYGEVASATWTSMNGSKLGSSSVAGISGPVFEPINEYKGDVARAYLYMVTRYETLLPTWNGYSTEGAETLDGTIFPGVDVNYLRLMIKWHTQDPPGQKERDRNNGAFSFQGNRNPFIDHPEYVSQVWNSSCPGLSALPVDMIFFSGKLNGNTVSLSWEVATEINLDRYEVQRSFNGMEYTSIGTVKAEGRSQYGYNDNIETTKGRRIYYRLKKVDKTGKSGYSAVFSLHVPLNTKFTVYPNPASDFIKLQLNNNSNAISFVSVVDVFGRMVYHKQAKAASGMIDISTQTFGAGMYIVKLSSNGEEYSQRVIVIK